MISLCELKIGQKAKILEFIDSAMKCYSVRFGLEEGQVVTCIAKPGPVVIKKIIKQAFQKLCWQAILTLESRSYLIS